MSKLIQNKHGNPTVTISERCICKPDNITIISMYHTYDSCLTMYLVATIVEKSGLSIVIVIDTSFLHLYPNVNTRVGSVPLLWYGSIMVWEPRISVNA
jgi:hypothetical protein